ncbi:MAG TPA: HHHH-motif protein [Rhizomicrobium sp.]
MKTIILAALALTVLGTAVADARPHHRRVCVVRHHHRVCHWR